MKIKFNVFLEGLLKELEKIKERRTVGDYEYWHVFLNRGILEYIDKAVKSGVNEKYCEIFEEYHQKSELNTAESIREILQNPLYDDLEKFSAILDRFLWAFRETHNDIHKIIKMNGLDFYKKLLIVEKNIQDMKKTLEGQYQVLQRERKHDS